MHIPQPGDEELPRPIDYLRSFGNPTNSSRLNTRDSITFDDDGQPRPSNALIDVDNGDVCDGKITNDLDGNRLCLCGLWDVVVSWLLCESPPGPNGNQQDQNKWNGVSEQFCSRHG